MVKSNNLENNESYVKKREKKKDKATRGSLLKKIQAIYFENCLSSYSNFYKSK